MADAFEFQLQLSGNFTEALGSATKGLGSFESEAKKGKKEVEAFEGEVGKLGGSVGGLSLNLGALAKGGSIFTFDLSEMVTGAIELVGSLVEKFVDLGKEIVETAAKTQDLDLAIKLDVGEGGAREVDALGKSFEKTSRFDGRQIKSALLPLIEAGGSDAQELDDLATAATDIAARRNSGIAGAEAALGAFQRIKLKGAVDGRALRELAVNEQAYFKDLGDLLGVSAGQAEALTKKHKVQTETLLSVALHQVAEREGGALGNATRASAETLGGTLTRLSNLKENLLERLADSPGLKKFQAVLDKFIDTLGGPEGDKLIEQFGWIVDEIGEMVLGLANGDGKFSTLVDTIHGGVSAVESFVGALKASMSATATVAEVLSVPFRAFWALLDGIVGKLAGVGRAISALPDFFSDAKKHGTDVAVLDFMDAAEGRQQGTSVVKGYAEGLADRNREVAGASQTLAETPSDVVTDHNEIHSPSRLFARHGGNIADGFAEGMESGRPGVAGAAHSSMNEGALAGLPDTSGGPMSFGGAPSITIDAPVNVVVSVGGAGAPNAQEVGMATGQAVRIEIVRLADELRARLGL